MEQVNHPRHYNARKDGLECIDIIRHYTFNIGCAIKYLWRAGIKPEMGKMCAEKEVEDLEKALWYIEDELRLGVDQDGFADMRREDADDLREMIRGVTGRTATSIASLLYYGEHVASAMFCLLHVGLVSDGRVCRDRYAVSMLRDAVKEIKARIGDLEKELQEVCKK